MQLGTQYNLQQRQAATEYVCMCVCLYMHVCICIMYAWMHADVYLRIRYICAVFEAWNVQEDRTRGSKLFLTVTYWLHCGEDATKPKSNLGDIYLTTPRHKLFSINIFRCFTSCNTLQFQNNVCIGNHCRFIVNVPNKRFPILILKDMGKIIYVWIFPGKYCT